MAWRCDPCLKALAKGQELPKRKEATSTCQLCYRRLEKPLSPHKLCPTHMKQWGASYECNQLLKQTTKGAIQPSTIKHFVWMYVMRIHKGG